MSQNISKSQFVVCIKNENYLASLEVKKIYQVISDRQASKHHLVRIIDESGEDYLYPSDYFVSIEVPETVENLFSNSY